MVLRWFLSLVLVLFFAGCVAKNEVINQNQKYEILKLEFPQNSKILPKVKNPKLFDRDLFLERFFRVWDFSQENRPKISKKEAFWALNAYKNTKHKKYYSPSRRVYDDKFFDKIYENANTDKFGELFFPAITLKNTFLRNAPTNEPIFISFQDAGEGYPFDYFANSTLGVNYPVLISHFSKNRDFVFVQTDSAWGWIDVRDIKILSQNEINLIKNSKFITILEDKLPLFNLNNKFLLNVRVGTLLMVHRYDDKYYYGEIFTKNGLENYKISKKSATEFPAVLNDENVKKVINGILGEPYGWGGFGYYRDCSLFTKDVMTSFGVWLGRNSKAQTVGHKSIDLSFLSSDEKLETIKQNATPYLALIYMPGHIMLYSGIINGEVSVIHNVWGLRTVDNGRALIGQTAITSLKIGQNNPNIMQSNLFLNKITKLILLD